ncbi:unnamed protein product, partial [Staurois parvus]
PARDSPPTPVDCWAKLTGETRHAALYFSVQQINSKQHVSLVKHTAHNVKQHTVNPLIVPDVNPFLPSVISTLSVLFISLLLVSLRCQ